MNQRKGTVWQSAEVGDDQERSKIRNLLVDDGLDAGATRCL